MKKLFFAAVIVAAMASCTKENVKPTASIKQKTVAEKSDVGHADVASTDPTDPSTTTGL